MQALEHGANSLQVATTDQAPLSAGQAGRPRNRTVDVSNVEAVTWIWRRASSQSSVSTSGGTMQLHIPMTTDSFCGCNEDSRLLDTLARDIFRYMLVALSTSKLNLTKPDIKAFFPDFLSPVQRGTRAHYLGVLDIPADSVETIKACLEMIHAKFEVGSATSHVIVAGDGKHTVTWLTLKGCMAQVCPGCCHFLEIGTP